MTPISKDKKFFSIADLKKMGYSYYLISKLSEGGILAKINRRTYENLTYNGSENDFFTAEAYVPNGVVCLMSAARYYELTTFLPEAVDVAIERKKRISTLPKWPEIKIYYFNALRMQTGVTEIHEGDNSFHVFDKEKTVIDIICYRNKLGIEETSEVLKCYLRGRDRQIDKLYAYAKRLRCESVVRTYLEVLL